MPKLELTNFNIVVAFAGAWVSLFGLVSYLLKEKFSLSEALIALLAGVAFGPSGANFVRPAAYAGSESAIGPLTRDFTRLVLGIQLVLAGVQLPRRYLRRELRSLLILVGPVLTATWLVTAGLLWALVPDLPAVHALALAACVAPTDPVLSAVAVRGRWADANVPRELQRLVVAESGANDGLGYPFLFLALHLVQFHRGPGDGTGAGVALALREWLAETWGWVIAFSIVYGAAVGVLARVLLFWARGRGYVDRESFLVFAVALALFVTGSCGILGTDDVLACFVAGNAFTWDDWFRRETEHDALQPTVDMLLNVAIFVWLGAVCPWGKFVDNAVIPFPSLLALGVAVLLFRRLPVVLTMHCFVPQIEELRQALFVGFFGPIGVSAIFYLYIALDFVEGLVNSGRSDLKPLAETFFVVVWFLAICSCSWPEYSTGATRLLPPSENLAYARTRAGG
ncbi:Na/H antiporter [Xylariomycetidae sp. FL0641]|nr:Na/H antiporter [Xylariomycetidae sp. FL0641]